MCGIAGCWGVSAPAAVTRMVAAQAHRGPDDSGVWDDPVLGVTLGHRRLSIIDASPGGHQPMTDRGGRLCVVFNGEIYNHSELRLELEGKGHHFRTTSDTEVVLAAYAEWGVAAFDRFVGMFALALVDRAPPDGAPGFLLVRDRLGIKPLLYCDAPGGELWFASEVGALVASGRASKVVDADALLDYLAVGSVLQPRTILAGVTALPAGHRLELRGGTRRLVRYWDLAEAAAPLVERNRSLAYDEAVEQLRGMLREATRYHLVADVPVGAFLSGGIDSTAVVGLMTAVSSRPVKTVSVGFEATHQDLDERAYASAAARHLGCDHDEVVVTSDEIPAIFERAVAAIDQPSIDGTNTWLVSRAARRRVTVALSGLGGDEVFAGYPHFRELARHHGARDAGPALLRRAAAVAARGFPAARDWELRLAGTAGRFGLLRRILRGHEVGRAVNRNLIGDFEARWAERYGRAVLDGVDAVQQTTYAEATSYLVSTLLRDGDVMSMAHGLEVRPVLLHHPLVEWAFSLPAPLKLRGEVNKALLVDATAEFIPEPLRSRRKMGFELPFSGWLGNGLRERARDLVAGPIAARIFTAGYREFLVRELSRGRPPRALWAWAILLAYLEANRYELPI